MELLQKLQKKYLDVCITVHNKFWEPQDFSDVTDIIDIPPDPIIHCKNLKKADQLITDRFLAGGMLALTGILVIYNSSYEEPMFPYHYNARGTQGIGFFLISLGSKMAQDGISFAMQRDMMKERINSTNTASFIETSSDHQTL